MNLTRTLTTAASAAATLALSAAVLAPVDAGAAPTVAKPKHGVTATTTSTQAVQDDDVVVKGTVTPSARGQRVVLQIRYVGGDWKRTKISDKVDGQGRFRLVDTIATGRSRSYRALVPATRAIRAGHSKALPVVVYSWRDLGSLTPVRTESTTELNEVKINGTLYPQSVGATGGVKGGTDYNLDYKCLELETRVGLNDVSSTGVTGTARLSTDGVERFAGTYALAQSATATVSLTNAFRLSFDWESSATDPAKALPTLGSPRILCRD